MRGRHNGTKESVKAYYCCFPYSHYSTLFRHPLMGTYMRHTPRAHAYTLASARHREPDPSRTGIMGILPFTKGEQRSRMNAYFQSPATNEPGCSALLNQVQTVLAPDF